MRKIQKTNMKLYFLILLSLLSAGLIGCTTARVGSSPLSLAHVAFQTGDYQSALSLYQETLETAKENNFDNGALIAHYNIGNTYVALGERAKALSYYREALRLSRRLGDYGKETRIEDKIATIDDRLKPPYLEFSGKFDDQNHNGVLEAGEEISLNIEVTNSGAGLAEDVSVALVGRNSILLNFVNKKTLDVGRLSPQQTKSANFRFYVPYTVRVDKDRFSIKVTESTGRFTPAPQTVKVAVKPYIAPKLSIKYKIDDDIVGQSRGNENSKIDIGERIELGITISNKGKGTSLDTKVSVSTEAKGVELLLPAAVFGNIPPGRSHTEKVVFLVSGNFKERNLPLKIEVTEKAGCCGISSLENFPVDELPIIAIGRPSLSEVPFDDDSEVVAFDEDIDTPPITNVTNPYAFAVVIGNRNYRNVNNIDYAINDAKSIKKYLIDVMGYREGNIFLIKNATQSDFALYFGKEKDYKGKLYNAVKEGRSDVFIYYSGHGAPGLKDRKGYFVPVEADPQYIKLAGYAAEVFYENLSKLPAKSITVVLDACFSGANIFDNISPIFVEINNPVIKLKNGVVISSSQGRQVSSWYNEKKHGLFTYFFLKAIHNKNADYDKDDRLTFDEIFRFISDNSEGVPYYARRIHGVEQTPTIQGQYQDKVLVRY